MRCFLIIVLLSCTFFSTFAQENSLPNVEKGYNIKIVIDNIPDKMLFLEGNYSSYFFIVDSAKIKKNGKFVFQNSNKIIPSGIYRVKNYDNETYFYLLIDNSRHFSIHTTFEKPLHYLEISESDENRVFFEYQRALKADLDLSQFSSTSPNSLLAKFIAASEYEPHLLPDFEITNNDTIFYSTNQQFDYYLKHYFDDVDFSDERLLHTPLNIDFEHFFTEVLKHQPAEVMIDAIENFLKRTISQKLPQTNIRDFYVKKIMLIYLGADPCFDSTYVYLFDTYCAENHTFSSNTEFNLFRQLADRKRRILPGKIVPELKAFCSETQTISTADLKNDYIILWFWDPDCDDCVELTPKLFDFYQQFHQTFNFEVYAVSVTPDFDRWKNFIAQNQLSWKNVTYALNTPNYDFVDYFDVMMTPVIFLIDKNHRIINRHFSLDELYGIISKLQEQSVE